jgi:hypothetical protein
LGFSASFRTWLNPFYDDANFTRRVTNGEYGLRLRLEVENETLSKESENNEQDNSIYDIYLNQHDMNGNPYEFETYFQ